MKHQWLAYVIVALLSIGAGVAIAGLPNNVPVDATIIPPTTTVAPEPTVPETTAPAATTTTVAGSTTTTTSPDTTDTTDGTEAAPGEVPERGDIVVVAANGANVAGAAQNVAALLADLGYVGVLPLNGSDIVEFTAIYHADGFEEAALRLAGDLEVLLEFVAPLAEAPEVADLPDDVEIVVYVGRDRA